MSTTISTPGTSSTSSIANRTLGRTGPTVSPLGVGTWALGGPFTFDGRDAGWGPVDDQVSVQALHAAIDLGVTLIDTAPCYGTGHSERVVGQALSELPASTADQVRVATKFGLIIDEESRTGAGTDVRPETIRAECEASLRRLQVEAIDVFQLHGGVESVADAEPVVAVLDELVAAGKVRWFGTAQDDSGVMAVFARSPHCVTVQTQVNVFGWSPTVLEQSRHLGLTPLARSPLAMGLLTGQYDRSRRPQPGDVRLDTPWWTYFDDAAYEAWLARLDAVRALLTDGGRTLVQGSLGYLWALDERLVPLPGVRTPQQAAENASALSTGPLPHDVAAEITRLMADSPERG